ncbi:hypothetical protein roselon_00861 [Roseibacterium elongatum DSM 19469]|uniref:DUF2125 domain-containing protein n=1 Tax=Roseicyclus elongatus DSM 19469 TaxID=1294273 RepID=W8S3C7_9RHOB|nr:DUF2125 domain-containing protein [Roseibacterium elongatum]AHM03271.1 hypothetical protein roselon_00861 [Roseibacterium elongatum DSM 19469]
MSHIPQIARSLFICTLGLAAPAHAQVSAADLWADWQATAAASGQEMTAEVTETETGLVLTDFTTSFEQDGTTNTGHVAQITLTEMPDGQVEITLSDTYTATVSFPEYDGGPLVTLTFELTHDGLDIVASGDEDSRSYDYSADAIALNLAEISAESSPPEITFTMQGRDLISSYDQQGTDPATQRFTSESTMGAAEAMFEVIPPEGLDGRLKVAFTIAEIASTADGAVGALALAGQAGATGALPEGFDISGDIAYARFLMDIAFDDGSGVFDMSYVNGGGRFATTLSQGALGYDIATRDMTTRISGSEIPIPIDLSVGAAEISLTAPLSASEQPQDAALTLAYEDVTMAEAMWAMFDPTRQIPRDPASVVLDLTAQLRLFLDLTAPEAMAMETPPGELRALTLNDMRLSLGGAELTGTGDMTFAEGQEVPMPVGAVELNLSGGNGLLDQLVAAGLVPAEQAAMARGIAGMFSRPGAFPDTLETTIAFGEGGTVTANGVPLQ